MRILFIASAYSIHTRKWIDYFVQKGHEIHLISLEEKSKKMQSDLDKNIKFYSIKKNLLGNLIPLRRLIRKINPDIVHAHYAGKNGFIAAFSNIHPFILTAWGSDILITGKSVIKRPFIKFILNKADLITCDAQHLKKAISEMGVPSSKIKIICFGIDTQKFSPGPKNKELEKKLGISGYQTIVSLRNIEPIYDIETLIRAMPLVLKEVPKTKLLVIGQGSQEKKLNDLAKELNISKNVRFCPPVFNDKIPQYLRLSDICVSPALSDAGIAGSTAEAMACQLPVIVTDYGDNRKWVEDGKNGFVIPLKNPEILAEKIIYLLKNPAIRQKFGKINREIIKERNDYYKEMLKMEEIYKKLMRYEFKR